VSRVSDGGGWPDAPRQNLGAIVYGRVPKRSVATRLVLPSGAISGLTGSVAKVAAGALGIYAGWPKVSQPQPLA